MTLQNQVDARPLAVARVLVGLAALAICIETATVLARLDTSVRLSYLPVSPPTPGWAANGWTALTVTLLVAVIAGLWTRGACAAAAILLALALFWDQQLFSNHLTLAVLLLAYLSLGDPGGAWSLDSRRRGRRSTTALWPQLLVMTQVSAVYLFAGLSKLNATYLSGAELEQRLIVPVPAAALPAIAVASVLTELVLAVALWPRATRRYAAAVGVALHLSIVVLLGSPVVLLSFGLLTTSSYPLFLTRPSRVVPALAR